MILPVLEYILYDGTVADRTSWAPGHRQTDAALPFLTWDGLGGRGFPTSLLIVPSQSEALF